VRGKASGKMHFEVRIDAAGPTRPGIGSATNAATLTSALGADAYSLSLYPTGQIYVGGAVIALPGVSYNVGDTVAVEVDVDAKLIYFQKAGGARSAGISFAGLSGAVYPAASLHYSNDAVTANFGASTWLVTPTTGFAP
jgi:hypothetical protein